MKVCNFFYFIGTFCCVVVAKSDSNLVLERNKRFLSYPVNGGIMKLVMGLGVPVDLPPKRSLGFALNLQAQYVIPQRIIRWSDKWQNGRAFERQKRLYGTTSEITEDDSRQLLYKIMEATMARQGKNGRECLLRAICEVAQHPLTHNGLVGEIIDSILTPAELNIANIYHDAKVAGRSGTDCHLLYQKCPPGQGLLDSISFLD